MQQATASGVGHTRCADAAPAQQSRPLAGATASLM